MTMMRQAYHQVSNREEGTGVNSQGQHGTTFRPYPSADGGTGRSNHEPLGMISRLQQQVPRQDGYGRDLLQQQVGNALQPLQQFNDAQPLPGPGNPFQVSAVQGVLCCNLASSPQLTWKARPEFTRIEAR
eukprot:1806268-Amphidinium_carterae.2